MQSLKSAPTVEQLAARVRGVHAQPGGAEQAAELAREIESAARWAEEDRENGRAMELWALLTDLDPWHAPWWHERGMMALRDGETRWARMFLARAAAIDPGYWPTRQALARMIRDEEPVRPPLADVLRSACARISRGEVDAARRALAEELGRRDADEVAATLMVKLCADRRW